MFDSLGEMYTDNVAVLGHSTIYYAYVADKWISCPSGLQGERDLCERVEEEKENGNDP